MLRVIIAEDNIKTAEGLARSIDFAAAGFECAGIAHNGRQALDLVHEFKPHAVITDVRMPIMDGLELTRRLKAEYPGISILILTAYDEFAYAKKALEYGVTGYLLKPLDRKKIISINRFLADIRNRIDNLAITIPALLEHKNLEVLYSAIQNADKKGIAEFINDSMATRNQDFLTRQRYAQSLAITLRDFAVQYLSLNRIDKSSLNEKIEDICTENREDDLIQALIGFAYWICDSISRNKDFTLHHVLGAILTYIQNNYADPGLSARQIMDKFNISQSYLCLIFKRHQGISLNSYITELRMKQALELLRDINLPIAAVAQKSGFSDPHYFSRVFRKMNGLAPADYRRINIIHQAEASAEEVRNADKSATRQ